MRNNNIPISLFLFTIIIGTISIHNTNGFMSTESFSTSLINNKIETSQHSGFENITDYWEVEKARVEGLDPALTIESTIVEEYNGINYNKTELHYEVPHWVGAAETSFTIDATLFTPTNESKDLELLPGIVCYHGLNSRREEHFDYVKKAITQSSLNCAFLCPDHPGHGTSEGPAYKPENWYYSGDFNITSHNYLAICAGLQAIRVIRSLDMVNNSQIGVTGRSYGGLTSMWVGCLYNEYVNLSMPVIACGGLNLTGPESLLYDVMKREPGTLDDFWQTKGLEIDPVYYLGLKNLPKFSWFFGTHDDFFPYEGLNVTYNTATGSSERILQISPNAHHALFDFYDSTYFMLRNTFFNGPAPPKISLTSRSKELGLLEKYELEVLIDSEVDIKSVEICYRYKDIVGEPWRWKKIEKEDIGSHKWVGKINTPWLKSETEFYIISHLDTEQSVWFTSQIFSAGTLHNKLSFLPIMAIIAAIAIPVIIILNKRYKTDVITHNPEFQTKLKRNFIIENIGVILGEIVIFSSLVFPWITMGPVTYDHIFLFNHIGTYTDILGRIANFSCFLVFSVWIFGFLLTLSNPFKGGFLNMIWPAIVILISTVGASLLGMVNLLSLGPFIFLIGALIQVFSGIYQKQYRKKYKITKKPYFHWLKREKVQKHNHLGQDSEMM
ncbi:MAG: hypothetical protein GF364_12720 [Candidatus Lokiarchaeota archaeon]|nr:hypothetical protein [Candidatus Lokiarchaeota archaeon]